MQTNEQPQDIEYFGTFKVKDQEMIEGPKKTLPGVELKGRVNAHEGFKDFEGPSKSFELGPGASRDLPPKDHVNYQLPKKSRNRKKPESSLKSICDKLFAEIWPKRDPEASNRPQDRSNVRKQAPDQQRRVNRTQFPAELGTYTQNNSSTVGPIRVAPPQRQIGRRQALSARQNMRAVAVRQKLRIVVPGSSARNTMKTPRGEQQENAAPSIGFAPTPAFHGQITSDQQRQMVPTQLIPLAKPGISTVNYSTAGPIRNAQQLQSVPIETKFRIVQGESLMNAKTKKIYPGEYQQNAPGFSTAPRKNIAPNPAFHDQIIPDQQCQIVPTQLIPLAKPGTSTVNSFTAGQIRNAFQLLTVPIEPKFRIVKGESLMNAKTKKSPAAHQRNVRGFSTPLIMDSDPALDDNILQEYPFTRIVAKPSQSQLYQNPAPSVTSSAPTPAVNSQIIVDKQSQLSPPIVVSPPKSNALENQSNIVEVNQTPQYHPNQFDDFDPDEEAEKLFFGQVEKEAPKKSNVIYLPYNGPVKVERLAYDELMDPNFKPVQTYIQYKSDPAAKEAPVKQPKSKKTESKKEEKKVVEEELEKGAIAALEYKDPAEQLKFEKYVKSMEKKYGDQFLGMLLFDLIPGLRLGCGGQIARRWD